MNHPALSGMFDALERHQTRLAQNAANYAHDVYERATTFGAYLALTPADKAAWDREWLRRCSHDGVVDLRTLDDDRPHLTVSEQFAADERDWEFYA